MFRDRINAGPFLIREITGVQDNSFIPKNADIATIIIDENNIQIQVTLENKDNTEWSGKILSYQPVVKGRTPDERLDEIKTQEEFINDNNFSIGSEISFVENKIFCLSR